ncbi:hypothetical protein BI364_07375 [Acidihalobacter yilgarnensis]|uniref:DUF4282 domain-containing protein n=1 Tax=Acidihalobacter yilgarnensis TaxID=2819280 RepID=A0A1D8IMW1_9GAMM|nr:hypothetical protein BI364_06845 [Acidihalobacter yilgarnensis]AOU97809.1 hypothetical protein BI364_07375 [Acidihalobacter yilgarnensis]
MPLSKIIVSSYAVLLEVAIWLILICGFIGGWVVGHGFIEALGGLVVSFIFCVVVLGAFLTIADIQKTIREIQHKQVVKPQPLE